MGELCGRLSATFCLKAFDTAPQPARPQHLERQ
jgi:hypothetical protein